ncbi:MAG: DNA repair protein RecO [Lachnospiraceae bacterium]|nr:DNA repair protein RecO [Lachnospiraceae bacterium]
MAKETADTAGMVLKAFDYAEYDRRLILLTSELGKITVFARGVRRVGNRHMAACLPLVFGGFRLFEGKTAYNLYDVEVTNYFEEIRNDMEAVCYASYFADLTERVTRENNDESEVLKLLYRSLQALLSPAIPDSFVRAVFELKLVMLNGEFGETGMPLLKGTERAVAYIESAPIQDLFSFRLKEENEKELEALSERCRKKCVPGDFKTLEVMRDMGYTNTV